MKLKIVVLPGDGVGPEVTEQAVRVLREVADIHGHTFLFEDRPAGGLGDELAVTVDLVRPVDIDLDRGDVAGRAGLPQSAKKSLPLFGPPP